MGREGKIPVELKANLIEKYLIGSKSVSQICVELSISRTIFYKWLRNYKSLGIDGLIVTSKNRYYSEMTKLMAVQDYLAGVGSYIDLCKKYGIPDTRILRRWIKKYNSHEEFKSHNAGGIRTMANGRKTNYEERTEIVAFCVAHNDNYQLAAEHFQVSYQQVYSWVQKYKAQGYEALCDRRGKCKKPEELTEKEKFAAQLKLLEAENKRLKMENAFLKKLDEVERRREKTEYFKKTDI